jgi:hypothetical protein
MHPTYHASVVEGLSQSSEVIRGTERTVELVQILLPVAVPWFAVRSPGLYLERDRRDPDLLMP